MRKIVLKQDLFLVEFYGVQRKVEFFKSTAQNNAYRISYEYKRHARYETIITNANTSANQVIRLSKSIRNEIQQNSENEYEKLQLLIKSNIFSSINDKKQEILEENNEKIKENEKQVKKDDFFIPKSMPLPKSCISPAFAKLLGSDYEPKLKRDQVEENLELVDYDRWRFDIIQFSVDERGVICKNVTGKHSAFTLLYANTRLAPETLINDYLPSTIQKNENLIRSISSNMECIHAIFEKLSLLQKGKDSSGNDPALELSPQEKEVLSLPDNILLLGRSGTGKTTCALLRLFARYKLFDEYKQKTLTYKKDEAETEADDDDDFIETQTFHPLFITLSPVLCNQSKKYFQKLCGGLSSVPADDSEASNCDDFNLKDNQFPLFLTLRQLLKNA